MRIGIKTSTMMSERPDGAANPRRAAVQDMGVNHRRLHVAMAQEFLNCPNVVVAFGQMRPNAIRVNGERRMVKES